MKLSDLALEALMQEKLEHGGYAVAGGRDLYIEVMDTDTGQVWMTAAPAQLSDFDALVVEPPLVKTGAGRAAMNRALFQYSPSAPAEPVRQRVIDGRLFINVASPVEQIPPAMPGAPLEALIDKAHVIGFEAGRSVAILSLPEGDFVEVVGDDGADASLVLPAGGVLKRLELNQPWAVTLPTPARVFFWLGNNLRSFQGPVALPDA